MSKPDCYPNYYTTDTPVPCPDQDLKFKHRLMCPGCVAAGHVQRDSSDAFDCKMVFTIDGCSHGQCNCYSEAHGWRRCQKCHADLEYEDGWNANKKIYDGPLCRKCRGTPHCETCSHRSFNPISRTWTCSGTDLPALITRLQSQYRSKRITDRQLFYDAPLFCNAFKLKEIPK